MSTSKSLQDQVQRKQLDKKQFWTTCEDQEQGRLQNGKEK